MVSSLAPLEMDLFLGVAALGNLPSIDFLVRGSMMTTAIIEGFNYGNQGERL